MTAAQRRAALPKHAQQFLNKFDRLHREFQDHVNANPDPVSEEINNAAVFFKGQCLDELSKQEGR